jgi:hypothetical protein
MRAMSDGRSPDRGWGGLLEFLSPSFVPPFIILLPLVLFGLIAFWIYVWITRDRRGAAG